MRLTNERVGVFLGRRSMQYLVLIKKHLNPEFRVFVLTVLYNQILNGLFSKCIYNPCGLKLH